MKSPIPWLKIVLLCTLASCATKRIQYSPALVYQEAEAAEVVRRFLEQLPARDAPSAIEISNEKISLTQYETRGAGIYSSGNTVPVTSTLYWDEMGTTELSSEWYHMYFRWVKDPDWFNAKIFNKNGTLFLKVKSPSKGDAQRFLDAMVSLSRRGRTSRSGGT